MFEDFEEHFRTVHLALVGIYVGIGLAEFQKPTEVSSVQPEILGSVATCWVISSPA